jgi:hypothetical protein
VVQKAEFVNRMKAGKAHKAQVRKTREVFDAFEAYKTSEVFASVKAEVAERASKED